MRLNPKQEEAKNKIEGPLLIIAGAGSGKTATLAARVNYMIKEKGISANSIMMVTFTNKAAKEMRERVAKTLDIEAPRNMYSKYNFPLIGTFHSIGIFILKEVLNNYPSDELNIGLKKDFVIYDESDKISVLKSIIKNDLNLEEKEFPSRQISFYISNAKNALISAKAYEVEVDSSIKEVVYSAYLKYEERLRQNNAMDFDDILVKTLAVLRISKILSHYQDVYKYLMVDEYQDTNAPQYHIIQLLASRNHNLAVVGDDSQCITGDSLIEVEGCGNKEIKNINVGDKILSYDGLNRIKYYPVNKIYKNNIDDYIYTIETESGNKIKSTSKHIFFSNPEENFKDGYDYGVYLMYKHNIGYRIGFTRFKGLLKSGSNIYGLRKRLNGEQADKAWILYTTNSQKKAKYYEQYYSFKYGIPQSVFSAKGKLTELDQDDINNIFNNIDTVRNAEKLMNDLNIDIKYPQIIASASNRFNTLRVNINFLMMGGNDKNRRFGMYRVTVHSSHDKVINLLQNNFPDLCRKSKLGIRIDKELASYDKILNITKSIHKVLLNAGINTEIIERLSYTKKSFLFISASNLQPGFGITIFNKGKWITEKIIKITKTNKNIDVYDLDIERTHNFVANNVLVHNSIYSWRGADMTNILNFRKDYPDVLIIKLEQNYRSTKTIIAGANSVIKNNTSGIKKELWTDNVSGGKIQYIQAPDDKTEASIIADIILKPHPNPPLTGEGTGSKINYSDNLVLYRTNAQSRQIEEAFMIKNIPYRVVGGLKFYDRKEVKDMLAYLRVIHNGDDVVSMKRIINTPTRKIGAKSIEHLDNYRESFGLNYPTIISNIDEVEELKPAARLAIKNFGEIFNNLCNASKNITVSELIALIIKQISYEDYIKTSFSSEEYDSKMDNLDELKNVASEYNGMEPRESLATFLEEVALITDMDIRPHPNPLPEGEGITAREDYVTLMTIHTSKGLEQKRVFLTGVEESIFPSFRSVNDNHALEEERRLMYVAMTRAKEELFISRATERFHFGDYVRNLPSRFLKEIDPQTIEDYIIESDKGFFNTNSQVSGGLGGGFDSGDNITRRFKPKFNNDLSQFNMGDRVGHHKFGNGIIVSLTGEIAEIAFTGKGIKKMNIKIAPVKKL